MVNRILAGKHPDTGSVGLWISKPGKDARTATSTDDFLFESSKFLNRPYAKFTVGNTFMRGPVVSTLNFADGTSKDRYILSNDFFHGLNFVPVFTVQYAGDMSEPWADSVRIAIRNGGSTGVQLFSYYTNDPNKTPIAGTVVSGYDPATGVYTQTNTKHSTFSIYRIPLV